MILFIDENTTAIVQGLLNDPLNNDYNIIDGFVWAVSDDENEEDFMLESDMKIVLTKANNNGTIFEDDVSSIDTLFDDEDITDLNLFDSDSDYNSDSDYAINPATGLPMVGSIDAGGNPYGSGSFYATDIENDNYSRCGLSLGMSDFDDSFSACSTDDDLFRSSSMNDDSLTSCGMDDFASTDTFGIDNCGCGTFDDF